MTIRILLIDDHAIVREGVSQLLKSQPDMRVTGSFGDGAAAIEFAQRKEIDVAIVDVKMPESSGIEIAAKLRDVSPRTQVLMLSMHSHPEYVYRALQAGAQGYVAKESAGRVLIEAVRAVHAGQRYLCEQVDREALERYFEGRGIVDPLAQLSAREREVLQLTIAGRTIAETAQQLGISPKSVETYRSRTMAKLKVDDLTALVKFAIRHGIAGTE